jgi:O-antigen/teichoic acid export membrane protein
MMHLYQLAGFRIDHRNQYSDLVFSPMDRQSGVLQREHLRRLMLHSHSMNARKRDSLLSRRLLSGSILRLGNLLAGAVAALLLMPYIVHNFGDRLYGFWSLALAFIGYYGLLDFGLSSAVSQYLCIAIGKKDTDECSTVFMTALCIQSFLGCIALIVTVAIAFATPWFCHSPADIALFSKVIVILGLNAALGFPAKVYAGVLDATLQFDTQSWLVLFGLVLRTGLTVCAIMSGGGLLAVAWVTLISSLPVIFMQIYLARRAAPWARLNRTTIVRGKAKSLFSYSIYTFITAIADNLRFQVDSLVITAFVGLSAVTHYRIASVFMGYYINAAIMTTGIAQPVLVQAYGAGDRDKMNRIFFFTTKLSLFISIFIGCILIFLGKPFITRWMGTGYQDAYLPLVVLTLAALLDVGQNPSIGLLYATFNHRFYTYINLAEGVLNLLFSLALVRPFGILGVALGTLFAAVIIRLTIQPWWVCKVLGFQFSRYSRFAGSVVMRCSLLMAAALGLSAWGLRPSYPFIIGAAICATVIYAAGSWRFIFTADERRQLLTAITNRHQKPAESAESVILIDTKEHL